MKSIFKSFLLLAAAGAALAGCQKSELENGAAATPAGTLTVKALAIAPADTRVTVGSYDAGSSSYPVTWDAAGETFKVVEYRHTADASSFSAQTAYDADDESYARLDDGTAAFTFSTKNAAAEQYDYWAVYPKSAYQNVSGDYVQVSIPATQTQNADGLNTASMVLLGKTEDVTEQGGDSGLTLAFEHVTAYVKMTLKNLALAEGSSVEKVVFTADKVGSGTNNNDNNNGNIAGDLYMVRTKHSSNSHNFTSNAKNTNSITVNMGEGYVVDKAAADAGFDVWFSAAPTVEGQDINAFTVNVYIKGENTPVSRTVKFGDTQKPLALKAQVVSSFSVDMAYEPALETVTIAEVTKENEEYLVGESYVAAAGSAGFIITDSSNEYLLVYTTKHTPAVGDKFATISGTTSTYSNILEFVDPIATTPAEGSQAFEAEASELTYADCKAMSGTVKTQYVTVKKVTLATNTATANPYKITFAEANDLTGLISKPVAGSDIESALVANTGKVVNLTGFFVGYYNSNVYFYATEVEEVKEPTLSVSPAELVFAAEGESKTAELTIANQGELNIETSITGDGADAFSASVSGSQLTVTAQANSGAERTATLTLTMGTATAKVNLTQLAAGLGSAEFDFMSLYSTNATSVDGKSHTDNDITVTFSKNGAQNEPTFYTADGIRLYNQQAASNSTTIKTAQGKITSVVLTCSSTTYAKNAGTCQITVDAGASAKATVSGSTCTFDVTGDTANLEFHIEKPSSSIQIRLTKIVVNYEK